MSKALFYSSIFIIFIVGLSPNTSRAVCLARDSFINEPHVLSVRNNTRMAIQISYFYNGCYGDNVVIYVGLLRGGEYGSFSEKHKTRIGQNDVQVHLNVPLVPYDNQSHKMVAFMMYEKRGQGKIIHHVPFEKTRNIARRQQDAKEFPFRYRVTMQDISTGNIVDARIDFLTRFKARWQFQGHGWVDAQVQTLSKRLVQVTSNIGSSTQHWKLRFSQDLRTIHGEFTFKEPNTSIFSVEGKRM